MRESRRFYFAQKDLQTEWRKKNISTPIWGAQSFDRKTKLPIYHEHILPKSHWEDTLWPPIRKKLIEYLDNPYCPIQSHTGTHNLLSSWVLCANLYFMVRIDHNMRQLMAEFLNLKISNQILEVLDVELEFAFKLGDELHPSLLLGEKDGKRGSGQTSPDIAFRIKTKDDDGLVLTECKYTEKEFYPCSARRTTDSEIRKGNPDPLRCLNHSNLCNYKSICHQTVWGRKYWDNLVLSEYGKSILTKCPASLHGYQLFRQQALAEGIMKSGRYSLVASTVAFDERNTELKNCLKSTGIPDFQTGWDGIFEGKSIFRSWTHQEWVGFVRKNQVKRMFDYWLKYMEERYGY